jgi:hypothetical protein
MITKRARYQFAAVRDAATANSLCVAECFNIATGKTEYVLCAHEIVKGADTYIPLAKFFTGNPNNEITPPGMAKYKLI